MISATNYTYSGKLHNLNFHLFSFIHNFSLKFKLRREQTLKSGHQINIKKRYKMDLIFTKVQDPRPMVPFELGVAEAELPHEHVHIGEDKLKLAKSGANILNSILGKNTRRDIIVPLLQLTGMPYLLLFHLTHSQEEEYAYTQ
jgi:hypothetical protein